VLKKIVLSLLFLSFVVLGGALGWLLYQQWRDPLHAIDRGIEISKVKEEPFVLPHLPVNRRYSHVVLQPEEGREIELFVSLPRYPSRSLLPVIMVLGGWDVKGDTLGLVPDPGAYILVVYRYGYGSDMWKGARNRLLEIFRIREAILSVPSRVLAAVKWLQEREDTDAKRVTLMGVSLGALFVPSIFHLAQERGVPLAAGVIAFGGADLKRLIRTNIVEFSPAAGVLAALLHPMEPSLHLSSLSQPMLLINGREDRLIPEICARELQRLKPEPKTVVWLDTRHIQPDREQIVKEVVDLTTRWLRERGLLR